jgi:hypothetical protein
MPEAELADPRQVLLVLGMHRSGTSLLSGLAEAAGIDLGQHLMPPADDNPRGYWENQRVVDLHERVLKHFDQSWASWKPMPKNWQDDVAVKRLRGELRAILVEEFGDKTLFSIKDPRLCRLLPMWHDLAGELGLSLYGAVICRPLAEVVASLQSRDGMGQAQAEALWLRYSLDLLSGVQDMPQVRTRYDALLREPQPVLREIGQMLGCELVSGNSGLPDPGLRHHNASDAPAGPAWAALMQSWLEDPSLSPSPDTMDLVMPLVADLADNEQILHRAQLGQVQLDTGELQSVRESLLFEQAEEARKFAASLEEERVRKEAELARAIADYEEIIREGEKEISSRSQHCANLEEQCQVRDEYNHSLLDELEKTREQLERTREELGHKLNRFRRLRKLSQLMGRYGAKGRN